MCIIERRRKHKRNNEVPEVGNDAVKVKKNQQSTKNRRIFVAILERLRKEFPGAFPAEGKRPVALQIGVREQLLAHCTETGRLAGVSRKNIRIFLRIYCRSKDYRLCQRQGWYRVNLAGKMKDGVNQITSAQADYAASQVKKSRKIQDIVNPKPPGSRRPGKSNGRLPAGCPQTVPHGESRFQDRTAKPAPTVMVKKSRKSSIADVA